MRYMIVDCRPRAEFEQGSLPTAYHVDPSKVLLIQ